MLAVDQEVLDRFNRDMPSLNEWMRSVKGELSKKNINLERKDLKDTMQCIDIQNNFKAKVKSF